MKLFLKILGGIIAFFVILLIALNLYLTDERLKEMIIPRVEEATGSVITAESMNITFFRTFPRFGVSISDLNMLTPAAEPFFHSEELIAAAELFPLFRNEISILSLSAHQPVVYYTVYADSTTNVDFLFDETEEEVSADDEGGLSVSIPEFTIRNGSIYFLDETSEMNIIARELDAEIELFYSDIIVNSTDIRLGSLSIASEGNSWITNLSLGLSQTSRLDLESEHLELSEGTFSIRGLALDIAGEFSEWSSGQPHVDLHFTSASDNFGELLRLAPPQFDEAVEDLETRGSLRLNGSVSGQLTEGAYPDFSLEMAVTDGYVQNPDLPEAIRDINFEVVVNNALATVRSFNATAGSNSLYADGYLERPLEEDGEFSLELNGDIDLSTVNSFYPLEGLGIEELSGGLTTDASATGRRDQLEDALFSGIFHLTNGRLKYEDVPHPVEEINAIVTASQDRIEIEESGFVAADNRLRLHGFILNPLDENSRTVDISSDLFFDLASISQFYPIDEDTLTLRGELTAQIVLRGTPDPDQLETLLQESQAQLTNGYISHAELPSPIEDLSFLAEASGRRLNIQQVSFVSGENALSLNGTVINYLSESPVIDLTFNGDAEFSSFTSYYSMEPWISELTGSASMNLSARGPVNQINQLLLNGNLVVENVSATGDSLPQPVTDLSATMSVTPGTMQLEAFTMQFGESDFPLSETLNQYMGFLAEISTPENRLSITGDYSSTYLNLDEMIDWDEESPEDEAVPINLPNLTAAVDAEIGYLRVFGLPVTNISGRASVTPELIRIENAHAQLFDGEANGQFDWNVPEPLRTSIRFQGSLDSLDAETFFRETSFLGPASNLHSYLDGSFSAEVDYGTALSYNASPDITSTLANGTFSMSAFRLSGHPIQQGVADLLNAPELANIAIDAWNAEFSIADTVMNIQNFTLTSGNIGVEIEGDVHMINGSVDYKATLLLPERFKRGIATVISTRAADALQLEDGRITVPLRITGTTNNPRVGPDTDVIEEILQDMLREGAGNILDRLLGN